MVEEGKYRQNTLNFEKPFETLIDGTVVDFLETEEKIVLLFLS